MYACIRTLLYNRADIGYLLLSWPLCRIFAVAASHIIGNYNYLCSVFLVVCAYCVTWRDA